MVHPASVTNAITRLEHRGLVERRLSPNADDRRVVLATITPDGQALVREATEALNQASSAVRPHRPSGRRGDVHPARPPGRGRGRRRRDPDAAGSHRRP